MSSEFVGRNTKPDDWLITPEKLKKELGSVVLIDVREPEEYAQGAIEGGQLIPMGELGARIGQLDRKAPTVLYCAHGVRSMQALFGMMRMGFASLRSLEGGIVAWEEAGGKISPTR